jgi:2,4-dienoyl-CoA reductase-like NADH-dependent reductase (Old Yellow Enzyme family)
MAALFDSLEIRSVSFRNRIGVSPMCQYSSEDGNAKDWHLVHLGSRAIGGAGLVIVEATAVEARGRISPFDAGLWEDSQIDSWRRVARFLKEHGAVSAVQLAHAGWKASTNPAFKGGGRAESGGWQPVSVGDQAFDPKDPAPTMLSKQGIAEVRANFRLAIHRAIAAEFQVIELHAAHGYLLHSFYSPISNTRTDEYGGSFDNRIRLLMEVTRDARSIMPQTMPLFVRISSSDWIEGGWTIEDSVALSKRLKSEGVDLIDCSSGGQRGGKITVGPHYQVPFAEQVRHEATIPTAAVGMITDAIEADKIIREGKADMVLLAREFLRDAYWPLHAAQKLGVKPNPPEQYARAF